MSIPYRRAGFSVWSNVPRTVENLDLQREIVIGWRMVILFLAAFWVGLIWFVWRFV